MPSFELLFGGYWFKVNPEDYVVKATDSKCALCMVTYDDYWILGDVFMRGWYSMHNLTNMKIGFHSIDPLKKPIPTKALTIPTKPIPKVQGEVGTGLIFGMDTQTFLIVICIVVATCCIFVQIVIFCSYALLKRTSRKENGEQGDYPTTSKKETGEESITLVLF